MRLFFVVLASLLFVLTPVFGGQASQEWWTCAQMGTMSGQPVYVFAMPFVSGPGDYAKKEKTFVRIVKKHNEAFVPEYGAVCRSFRTEEKTLKHLRKSVKQAQDRNFMVNWVGFAEKEN